MFSLLLKLKLCIFEILCLVKLISVILMILIFIILMLYSLYYYSSDSLSILINGEKLFSKS